MQPRRVGIKDVAEAAGVSATTVSHALNGKGRLPEATRERIRRLADELGYRPSATARNLAGGRTGLLGLVVPPAENTLVPATDTAYFVQLMSAATVAAMRGGYALVVALAALGRESPFDDTDVDGVVIVDPVARDPLVLDLVRAGVPTVTTGRVLQQEDGTWVDNDHRAGTQLVLDHLAEMGSRAPALMSHMPGTSFAADVEAAYGEWCARRGCEPLVVRASSDVSDDAVAELARRVLDHHPAHDAVFATLDRLALATLHEARERGIDVPGGLLVAGATDSDSARWAAPSLTALNLHPGEIGAAAVELLLARLSDPGAAARQRHVPVRLVVRDSTGAGVSARPVG